MYIYIHDIYTSITIRIIYYNINIIHLTIHAYVLDRGGSAQVKTKETYVPSYGNKKTTACFA